MAKKLSKSNQHLNPNEVADIFTFREKSLKLLFSNKNPNYLSDFIGLSLEEIEMELNGLPLKS